MTAPARPPVPIRAHLVVAGDVIVHTDGRQYRVHSVPVRVVGKHRDQVSIPVRRADAFGGWVESLPMAILSYRRSNVNVLPGGAS